MSEAKRLRVLVVDDEPLARKRVEDLLAKVNDVDLVGTASTGDEAIAAIERLHPDLVFLDVQMPARSGFEVVEAIGAERMPATIFATAFDHYAIRAFDVAAVDYLVKPFDDERFAQALSRARKKIELQQAGEITSRLLALVREQSSEPPIVSPKRDYLDRIAVEGRGQARVVPVSKIDYITASGPYAELHVGDRAFAVRERMQTLEEKLDPAVFFRIHRSVIVRLDLIDTLRRASGGDYAVRLKNGQELPVSRTRREELEEAMGLG